MRGKAHGCQQLTLKMGRRATLPLTEPFNPETSPWGVGRDALHEAQEPRASVTGSSVPSVTAELGRAGPGALRPGPIRAPGLQLCAFNLCDLVGRVTALSPALAPR